MCRTRSPKPELLRFRRGDDGWRIDPRGRAGGRGAWICRTCAETRDPKALRRAFRGSADDVAHQLELLVAHTEPDRPDAPDAAAPPTSHDTRPSTPEDPRSGGMHG